MIIEKCKSYSGECPCVDCEEYCCCIESATDTEKLCKSAKEYCESVHGETKGKVQE